MTTFAESLFNQIPATYIQLFHGDYEPVWIINPDEVQLIENVPQYYPPMPEPPPPPSPPKPEPPVPTVVRVPMCCTDCEERVHAHLIHLKGLETLKCDFVTQKVVVTGPVPAQEVLSICRKMFKQSEMWK